MNIEQALRVANTALFAQIGRRLTEAEAVILLGSLESQTYEEIAETSGYAISYLKRDVGPKLWKLLEQAFGKPVSKTNFRSALEECWRKSLIASAQTQALAAQTVVADSSSNNSSRSQADRSPAPKSAAPQTDLPQADWGEMIDVSTFYGRISEISTLSQWIMDDRCRLVALLGMGGMGKTALSIKLIHQLLIASNIQGHNQFKFVIWRSLRNAPPLETLLADLIPILSHQQDTQADLNRLMHYLRSARCLVILDNMETILQGGNRAGQFRSGYENYGELLRMVSESNHQSCLLCTSREKPAEVAAFEGIDFKVRSLSLSGSQQAAQAIVQAKGLIGSDTQKELLGDRYGNSPLALKIVATSIQDLFSGEIGEFLEQDTIIFNGIRRLLDQQFDRLSNLEKITMYWLAINREWTTIAELHSDITPAISRGRLLETLESLNGRSLIEKQSGRYTQQPVVMEYVTEQFIEQIVAELQTIDLKLFSSHALMKTTMKDYVRESQVRLIVQPIANQLQVLFGTTLEQKIVQILTMLRQTQSLSPGYESGNLINLCCHLQIDLAGYDFSHLTIWHAYLEKVNLHSVNFANANLLKPSFAQNFGCVLSVAFSPNGDYLAMGDAGSEVRLWRVADSQLLFTCTGHSDWVRSVAFSPDSRLLVSGSDDQTMRIWETETGRCLTVLAGHTSRVGAVAFSPNGQTLVSSSEDQTVRIWNIHTGKCCKVFQGHTQQVWAVAFSPDGRTIASGSEDQTVRIWGAETGEQLKTLTGHTNWVWSVAFSPDGQTIASGSHDQTIKLWSISTGECLKTFDGHHNWVWTVAFSPDGQILASGSEDETVRLWQVATGICLKTLAAHTNRIWAVAFSADGQVVASGSDDQTVKLWQVNTGQCLKTLQGHTKGIWSVDCSPDGQTLASCGDEKIVRLWDIATGQCKKSFAGHKSRIEAVAFSPNGHIIASSSEDQTLRLWDIDTGQCLHILRGHSKQVWSVTFSPLGDYLASGSEDQTIRIWQVSSGECLQVLQGHTNWVWAIDFSPDGRSLVSASYDQTVKLWSVETAQPLATFQGHGNSVIAAAFSPDGRFVASGGYDKTIKFWDIQSSECLQTCEGHSDAVCCVCFSPDGKLLASTSMDCTIKLWDIEPFYPWLDQPKEKRSSHPTATCLKTLEGHTALLLSIVFSPDGNTLISGSLDETIKHWDIKTGKCLQTLRVDRPYENMNITGVSGITEAQKATLKALGAVGT